jgi:5-methylcytosine-specific restriction protein A
MPRAMKVCSTPGCPDLVPQGTGRCPTHTTQADRARGTATQRGYGHQWGRTRQAYLTAHPFCAVQGCHTWATDVDHIDGLGPRGPRGHDWSNLRSLCHSHHSKRTAIDQPGGWNDR